MKAIDQATGLIIDDYSENTEYTPTHWTQLCENHAVHDSVHLHEIPTEGLACGVKGCNKEAVYYYDFNPKQ